MASTWLAIDHLGAVEGHWANGLANHLDGTEDDRLRGDASKIFAEWNLAAERRIILARVKEGAARGSFGLFVATAGNARTRVRAILGWDITILFPLVSLAPMSSAQGVQEGTIGMEKYLRLHRAPR